ncbi:hypothetical protein COV18_05315 [Candidatus Woesearchaeota archaeon CG10_big_fil_rev_8_21_14_0_10_37_12]|nr:MAG: hypothetical protein COV18_05315 [Candidatus Woesearchaeota archaeon CG10_big_fil_rev_8_21_14_0_10_37_12]
MKHTIKLGLGIIALFLFAFVLFTETTTAPLTGLAQTPTTQTNNAQLLVVLIASFTILIITLVNITHYHE